MSDINMKQIELAARQYANKTQLMSNYPHDWQSSYDAYIQGATDVLQPKQANDIDKSTEQALPIRDVVGRSEQLRACKKLHKCSNPGVQCRDGKYYACYE